MTKLILFTFLLLSFVFNLAAQENDDDSVMKMTKCAFEPDAPAVVIFDKGETNFYQDSEGFYINFERHKRVKIFKESAFDLAEISIDLYIGDSDLEKVYDIEATTYNFNGDKLETTHLDPKQIFREPINDYWYRKKFALPKVKEGCVIDYKYKIRTPFFMHLPDWEFQSEIPTIYSEYKVGMIPFYTYMYRAQGFSKFDIFENKQSNGMDRTFMNLSFKDMVYKFGMNNVASFKDESYISSREDYIKKLDFQLAEINYPSGYSKKIMSTWPELSKEFNESSMFGKYIKKTQNIGKKQFTHLAEKSDMEKVDAILDYMKKNYKPNEHINKWASKSVKEFTKEKTGNTANINLMALGYLRSTGIEAFPVIISTRNHGKVSESFPFSDLFNNVLILATIDGKQKLFDATDSYCPNTMIPANCCNGKGYVITEEGETWIRIKNHTPSVFSTTVKYKLNPNNNMLEGFGAIRSTGHLSINERKKYNKDVENFNSKLEEKGLTLIDKIKVKENEESQRVFQYNFDFESQADQIENQIIFAPFLQLPVQTNPFKQEKRKLAIDLIYPTTESYQAEIEIPEGYHIEQLPQAFAKSSENTMISFKAHESEGNKILITGTYQLKKPVYPASVYPELKRLFGKVIEKLNQKIVIIKDDSIAMQ